jgi:hypothetical protein
MLSEQKNGSRGRNARKTLRAFHAAKGQKTGETAVDYACSRRQGADDPAAVVRSNPGRGEVV